jgi:hypothetical protein
MNNSTRILKSNKLARTDCLNSLLLMLLSAAAHGAPSPVVTFGSYDSHQVNVDANGQNIVGDKGNEPTIAINPTVPGNIVVGWRRFEPFVSSIKQAGYGYSFDGGQSWGNGILPVLPSIERTDPVLDVDSQGSFYYQSMAHGSVNESSIFKSLDGGMTWSDPVYQFIGDKNWLAIDKTGNASEGNIYSTWRASGSTNPDPNYVPKYFIRSTDGGVSYQEPYTALLIPNFGFGRIAIGPDGDVFLSGIDETFLSINSIAIIRGGHYFLKSVNASQPTSSPTFTAQQVDLGGNAVMLYSLAAPNPLGSHGDLQIATDQSVGPMRGNIYMMAHTQSYGWQEGDDPLDVHFVRSVDGGLLQSVLTMTRQAPVHFSGFQCWVWLPIPALTQFGTIPAKALGTCLGERLSCIILIHGMVG